MVVETIPYSDYYNYRNLRMRLKYTELDIQTHI